MRWQNEAREGLTPLLAQQTRSGASRGEIHVPLISEPRLVRRGGRSSPLAARRTKHDPDAEPQLAGRRP